MSKGRSLPGYSTLTANYPVDSDSAKVIQQIGGDLTQSWVGSNSCVMRMCKAFNYAGKEHAIPKPTKQFLTLTGADKKWYGIRVIEFIDYLRNTYRPPDLVKKVDADVSKVLDSEQPKAFFQKNVFERVTDSPAEFSKLVDHDIDKWGTLIKQVGVKID